MLITPQIFTTLIVFAVLIPIISSIMLFMNMAFEREFQLLAVEKQNAILEKEFQYSQYMQLNTQIHPHFLFNTMNLILGLARLGKKQLLIETIENLSNLLKFKYQLKDYLIPFETEFTYTYYYLTIQKNRFGDRFSLKTDIQDEVMDALVPPYMLQTLTENSFKHGLEKKVGKQQLFISFKKDEGMVELRVRDNGVGSDALDDSDDNSGRGLSNIRKRLILLFGVERVSIQLSPLEEGTEILLRFPYRTKVEEEVGGTQ
ncbi:histidine kinase [Bacillaceae bacterium S4-13-58]